MIKYKIKGSNAENIIDCVLENRGITREEVNEIINPSIEQYDPMLMKDMDKAIESLEHAIENNLKIGIVADVDVDGYTSSSSINDFITEYLGYKNIDIVFHKINTKSHGVDDEISNYIKNNNISYVILPDAGSGLSDYKNIKILTESHNIKFLILDHHDVEFPKMIKEVTLVNNKRKDCTYNNKSLSGMGTTYKFIKAFADKHNIDIGNKYIDLVALSLISDMCDMKDSLENRLLFNIGSLKENIKSPLIQEFIVSKGIPGDKITIENYAFIIGSQINATIRCGSQEDKEMLFESFHTKKSVPSNKRGGFGALEDIQVETIRRLQNTKTKQDKLTKSEVEKLKNQIEENNLMDDKVLMINTNKVDNSISGLIANKIMGEFKRPVIMCKEDKTKSVLRGSARGLEIMGDFKDICSQSKLFNYSSGHSLAFGVSIDKDKLESAREYFNTRFKDVEFETILEVDAAYSVEIPLCDIKAISELSDLWCNQIKEGLFLIKNIELDTSQIMKLGNATYVFKSGHMSFTKNFGSRVWIEEFTHQPMIDSKARYPFKSKNIICDIVCKFRKNDKGYAYLEVVDTKSKILL